LTFALYLGWILDVFLPRFTLIRDNLFDLRSARGKINTSRIQAERNIPLTNLSLSDSTPETSPDLISLMDILILAVFDALDGHDEKL
jgi:hypothetical protein